MQQRPLSAGTCATIDSTALLETSGCKKLNCATTIHFLEASISRLFAPLWSWRPCAFILLFGVSCNPVPRSPDTVSIAIEAGPNNLDPRVGLSSESERIHQLLFNSLVRRGARFEILPDLAERWETPDVTTYRFILRPGIRFHNGKLLSSADVRFTLQSLLNGQITSPKTSTYRVIDRIETPDNQTIVFRLKEPNAAFLWNLTNGGIGIVPDGADANFQKKPIGTGPFRFVSYAHEEEVVLEANPDYFRGPPTVRRVSFRVIPDATTRALELRKGSVDIGQNVLPPDFVKALEREPHLRVETVAGTNYQYLALNMKDPLLADKRVRKAIAFAVPREDLIRYYWRDLVTPASGLLPPNHWAYESHVETYPHDPARARQLLDEAGLKDPDGEGPQPRFALTFKTSTDESTRQVAAVIQQQLKEVGIRVDLRSYEFGTFYGDIVRGNFQMFTLRWIGGNNDPDLFERVFHSREAPPRGYNRGRYENARVDALIEFARRETDLEKRRLAYSELQQTVADELPYISLWYLKTTCVYNRRLSNLELSPAGHFDFLQNLTLDGSWSAGLGQQSGEEHRLK
ncbi:MAG: ABC transporter substrate-binding protein [Acidimicrobiia bacterium]|nr:ABC transporter substrate-binding protein [Acidimicrobiia bacterium]